MSTVTAATPAISFRLNLTIGRTTYALQPIEDRPRSRPGAFRLVKRDGTIYDVESTIYGPVCDCPDYVFRRDGRDPAGCKHIKALVGSGLIAGRTVKTPAVASR